MELKRKKSSGFRSRKKRHRCSRPSGCCRCLPVLYDGKADLDKESVLHKISGNYELPIYAGELPKEVQDSLWILWC